MQELKAIQFGLVLELILTKRQNRKVTQINKRRSEQMLLRKLNIELFVKLKLMQIVIYECNTVVLALRLCLDR